MPAHIYEVKITNYLIGPRFPTIGLSGSYIGFGGSLIDVGACNVLV